MKVYKCIAKVRDIFLAHGALFLSATIGERGEASVDLLRAQREFEVGKRGGLGDILAGPQDRLGR